MTDVFEAMHLIQDIHPDVLVIRNDECITTVRESICLMKAFKVFPLLKPRVPTIPLLYK